MRPNLLPFACLLAAVTVAMPAIAQSSSPDVKAADALFASAKAAMERGDFATACPRFAESQRLDPATGTILNMGECEARAGRLAVALAHFQMARAALPAGDFRIPFADQKIAGLLKQVPRLVIKAPAGDYLHVLRDGVEVPAASIGKPVPVDPGAHVCTLRMAGHADTVVEVPLAQGEERVVELAPGAVEPAQHPPTTAAPPPPSAALASDGKTQRTLGLALGAGGALALAVGTVFGLVAKSTYDSALQHCPSGPATCEPEGTSGGERAHSQASAATVSFVAAGVLLGLGATVYFTAPRSAVRAGVTPIAGPKSAGLGIGGAF
jgi:hypothetical protein